MDAEQRGAVCRGEVHHVHDGCGRDGCGALHGERQLHPLRAVHAAGQTGHQLEHGPDRHDELHGSRHRLRCERERAGAGDGPGRIHVLAVDAERRGAAGRAKVHHVYDGRGRDGDSALHREHRPHALRAVRAASQAGHHFEHVPRRRNELHRGRPCVRDERERAGAGDGPGRIHLLAVDSERRGAESRAEVRHVHDGRGRDGGGGIHGERQLHADGAVHAACEAGH